MIKNHCYLVVTHFWTSFHVRVSGVNSAEGLNQGYQVGCHSNAHSVAFSAFTSETLQHSCGHVWTLVAGPIQDVFERGLVYPGWCIGVLSIWMGSCFVNFTPRALFKISSLYFS